MATAPDQVPNKDDKQKHNCTLELRNYDSHEEVWGVLEFKSWEDKLNCAKVNTLCGDILEEQQAKRGSDEEYHVECYLYRNDEFPNIMNNSFSDVVLGGSNYIMQLQTHCTSVIK